MLEPISSRKIPHLKQYLDQVGREVETPSYIDSDPIRFMYEFEDKVDRELAGFFAAVMAWGRRDIVIKKVHNLLLRMDYKPSTFIGNFNEKDAKYLEGFKHRTFKPVDIYWMIQILQTILLKYGDFESFWSHCYRKSHEQERPLMGVFHEEFFKQEPQFTERTRKHISNAEKNSSCKRPYLFLRWCLRKNSQVDTGIMSFMDTSELKIPLDVHVARQARRVGLLTRSYNDWKAVIELTNNLRKLDPADPAKYDYALFGIGIREYPLPEELLVNPNIN